jgi:esterase/lipase
LNNPSKIFLTDKKFNQENEMQERDLLPNHLSTNVRIYDFKNIIKNITIEAIRLKIKLLGLLSTDLAANYAFDVFCTPRFSKKETKAVEQVFNQSVKHIHVIREQKIHSYVFGSTNEKSILLVHGWEGQARDYFKMIPALVAQGYKVIAIDGPAHGRSTGSKTNLIEFVETLHEIVEIYGPSFQAIIGHSFGGASVVKLLSDHPELDIRNVISISSPNKIINIFKGYAKFMGFNSQILKRLVSNIKKNYGEDIQKINVEDLYKNVKAKKLLIHDLSDHSISYSIAEEILENNKDIDHLQTNSLGHLFILRTDHVHEKIIKFVA